MMLVENVIWLAALFMPWVTLIVNAGAFSGRRSTLVALASILVVYAALLLAVYLIDIRLERELYAFALNRDGVFTQDEINPVQAKAMENVVNDTGRAMAPITAAIFSVLYVLAVVSAVQITRRGIACVFQRSTV